MESGDSSSTRRTFLRYVGTGSATLLAGCGTDSDRTGTTRRTTEVRSSTETDETSPEFADLSIELDDPQTTGGRTITVSGTVRDDVGVEAISLRVDGAEDRKEVDGQVETDFQLAVAVDGGRRYEAVVTGTDSRRNTHQIRRDLGYVASPTMPVEEDRLVGAHYYGWWGSGWHWDGGYPGTPTLGEYDSRDEAVIEQHLDWLRRAGVNWLSLSWWGPDSWSDVTFTDYLLPSSALGDEHVSVLYESTKRLTQGETWHVDFDDPENRDRFVEDIEYLASEYFPHENYLYLDGRPVVYLYVSSGFIGDFPAAVRDAEDAIGEDLYLIGDFSFESWTPEQAYHLDVFEGVSNYTSFYEDAADVNERVPEYSLGNYLEWRFQTVAPEVEFIPTVMPGFDKTKLEDDEEAQELPILRRSPEDFRSWCEQTLGYLDPDRNAVLVTSFNEWHEGTQLEPAEAYGTAYLDALRETIAEGEGLYVNADQYGVLTFSFEETIAEHTLGEDNDPNLSRDLAIFVSDVRLRNAETGWSKSYDVAEDLEEPLFLQGVHAANPNHGKRWFGGRNGRADLAFDWATLSKATEVSIEANAQWELSEVETTLLVEGTEVDSATIREEDRYAFSLEY